MAKDNSSNEEAKNKRRAAAAEQHVEQCLQEKNKLTEEFPIATRLLAEEVENTQKTGRAGFDDRYIDVYNEKPIKVQAKVLFPTKDVPTEEELRNSNDPRHAHLSDVLHVEVVCLAPPSEAYSRIAYALSQLRLVLVPDPPGEGFFPFEEDGYAHGRIPPLVDTKVKVMGFLEKARHSMDYQPPMPPRRGGFGGGPVGPVGRAPRYQEEPYHRRGDDEYGGRPGPYGRVPEGYGGHEGGFGRAPAGSHYPPRPAPYSRY